MPASPKVGFAPSAQVRRPLIPVTLGSPVGGAVATAIAAGISGWLLQSLKPALDPRRWRRSTLEWSAITAVTADALGVLSAIGYSGYKPPPGVWLNLAPLIEPFMLWVFGLGLGGLVASVRLGILLRRKIPKLSKIRMLVIDAGWLIGLIVACIVSGLAAALVMNMTA